MSIGSVSIMPETGDASGGDTAVGRFPLRLSPELRIFSEDMQKVTKVGNC